MKKIFIWRFLIISTVMTMITANNIHAKKEEIPLWPAPHELTLLDEEFDINGQTIHIPTDANEKSIAIANLLAKMMKRHLTLPASLNIIPNGTLTKYPYVISIGVKQKAWDATAKKLILDDITPSLRNQAYLLDISPKGVVIIASGARGLYHGAITLIQLARCSSKGSKIPCMTIRDWPDLEIRGVHVTNLSIANRQLGGASALDGKINMLVWENHKEGFAWKSHPEITGGQNRFATSGRDYESTVQEIRSLGIEMVPLRNMALGHSPQSGLYPYAFLGDNETYHWAIKEIIDSELEVFTPRYFHLGMDEEKLIKKRLYPTRTMNQWRDVAVECMSHLRRRGVMGIIWTEMLFPKWGGQNRHYDWEKCVGKAYPGGYCDFTATVPNDLILLPWFYWTKTQEDTLGEKGNLRAQAKTGNPIIVGAYETHILDHTMAVKMIKPKRPNVLGVLTTSWGGRELYMNKYPRYAEYIRRASGPFWNRDITGNWPAKGESDNRTPFWNDGTDRAKDFRWPAANSGTSNLACLLDAEPPTSISEAIERLKNDHWRIWTSAREQLVAAGFPAAPLLLDAMSKAKGQIHERIEGCLSRNARDARNGRKRGALDISKVMPFLHNKNEILRDIAAEVLVASGENGEAEARSMIRNTDTGASCIRALSLIKEPGISGDLIALVGDPNAEMRSRIEAARVLGILRVTEASGVLRMVLRQKDNNGLNKVALWSLALIGCMDADKEIAMFLDSDNNDTRYRAATALTILKSPETKRLIPWLSRDRHSLELAAWSMWKTWKDEDAMNAFRNAIKTQKDEISQKRLEMLVQKITSKEEKGWRY